jgi:hypothetical protein
MDLTALSAYSSLAAAIGQIVSAVAVVVSLIYLARQLQHNTRAVQAQTFISVMANNVSVMSGIYLYPEFAELVANGASNRSSQSPTDALRWHAFMRTMFRQLDNVYHQSQAGALETDIWPGYEDILITWLRYPGCFRWFEENAHFFSGSLQKLYAAKIRPQLVSGSQEIQPAST